MSPFVTGFQNSEIPKGIYKLIENIIGGLRINIVHVCGNSKYSEDLCVIFKGELLQ